MAVSIPRTELTTANLTTTTANLLSADTIPAELRSVHHWATRRAKVPYISGTDRKASSTDPKTWGSFYAARKAVESGKADGLYYALSVAIGIVGIDLDHCVEDGVVDPWAMVYVRLLDSYTCLSPSGTGIRIFVKGTKPSTDCKRGRTECYDHDRFLSVTDQRVPGTRDTIEHRQAELEAFHRLAFPKKPTKKPTTKTVSTPRAVDRADADLFAAAMRDTLFARLHRGDVSGYPSQSEARMAYLLKATFYTRHDAALIDTWFRASGLDQTKWERLGNFEISKALDTCSGSYDPDARRSQPVTTLQRIETSAGDSAEMVCIPRAEYDRLIAEVADLRAGSTRMAAVLRNKQLVGNQKNVALAATFEIVSMETRQRPDRRVSRALLAEKAGVSESTISDAMKHLAGPGGVFIREEHREKVNPYTGEIYDQARRIVGYRPRIPTVAGTLAALADFKPPTDEVKMTSWGGKRQKVILPAEACICAEHPEAGSVVRCGAPTCNRALIVAVPADLTRWRPRSQDDFMEDAPAAPVDTSLMGHLDFMGNPDPSAAPTGPWRPSSQDDFVGAPAGSFHDETVLPPPFTADPTYAQLDWGGKMRRERERDAALGRIATGGTE